MREASLRTVHRGRSMVKDYVERFERGENALSSHLMTFLRDWLTTHIQKEDRDYSPWLLERGIR